MRTITAISFSAVFFTIASCHGPFSQHVRGNGVLGKESRAINGFDNVTVNGSPDIVLHEGENFNVSVEADENLLKYIRTRVVGDELIVDIDDDVNVSSHNPITVHVTAPKYDKLSIEGSGNITSVTRLNNNDMLKFSIAGSGDITAEVNAPKVECTIAGSGNISIKGEAKEQKITVGGNGDVKNADLKTEQTKISIAGSGNAEVHASVSLDINVAGSGDVFYRGNPNIKQSVAGSGEVKKMD